MLELMKKIFGKRPIEIDDDKDFKDMGKTTLLYKMTVMYRIVKLNRDLSLVAIILAATALSGYTIRDFDGEFFSSDKLYNYLEIAIYIIVGIISGMYKVNTQEGKIVESIKKALNESKKKVDKPAEQLSAWGTTVDPRTIVRKTDSNSVLIMNTEENNVE